MIEFSLQQIAQVVQVLLPERLIETVEGVYLCFHLRRQCFFLIKGPPGASRKSKSYGCDEAQSGDGLHDTSEANAEHRYSGSLVFYPFRAV